MKTSLYYGTVFGSILVMGGMIASFFFLSLPRESLEKQALTPKTNSTLIKSTSQAHIQPIKNFQNWSTKFTPSSTDSIAQGIELAKERKQAMIELIKSNPQLALQSAIPYSIRSKLPKEIIPYLEKRVSGKGDFNVIATLPNSDPEAANIEVIRRTVSVNGERYKAYVYGRRLGQTTKINIPLNGIALDQVMAVNESPLRVLEKGESAPTSDTVANNGSCPISQETGNGPVVEVGNSIYYLCNGKHIVSLEQKIIAAEGGTGPYAYAGGSGTSGTAGTTAASSWTQGPKKVLFMRAEFSDVSSSTISSSTAQTLIDTYVNNYYLKQSYGKTSLSTVVTPVLRMPRTASYYYTTNDLDLLLNDARNVARSLGSTYDTDRFDFDIVAFPQIFSGWSGMGYIGWKGIWLNGSFAFKTAAHELGHNYGVGHANYWNFTDGNPISPSGSNVEYGNPFDVMGGGSLEENHFNAYFKNLLSWLTSSQVKTITASGTYRIYAYDSPLTTQVGALKIAKDSTKNYWLEFRQKQTANSWLMNGVSVNWGYNSSSDIGKGSHLLDLTPGSNNGKTDSALVIGRTFSDPVTGIHITPISKGGTTPESLDVTVNMGTFSGNNAPIINTLTTSASSISANGLLNLTANASDPDGNPLAYYWTFGGNAFESKNSAAMQKAWTSPGNYTVTCEVSDMRGGKTSKSTVINVTSPTVWFISGTVSVGGSTLADVVVSDGTRSATTDSAGKYTIWSVPNGTFTLTPTKSGYSFSSRTVTVSSASKSGIDFSGTVETTPPTLAVTTPANLSYTINNSVTITGTASDASGILSVKLGNTTASTSDGFAHWTINAPLVEGVNTLSFVATDKATPANTATVTHKIIYATGTFDGNNDGLPDVWQIKHFGLGFTSNASSKPNADPDGDQMTNAEEYAAETNPLDHTSLLKITKQTVSADGNSVTITWSSINGKNYTVEYSKDCRIWFAVSPSIQANASTTSWIDDGTQTGGTPKLQLKRYYRIKTSSP